MILTASLPVRQAAEEILIFESANYFDPKVGLPVL
jgi:hypothetical protein